MPDVTVTLGADAAEFKQALTEIQKSVDSLVNSTTAKTAQLGLAFSGVKDMVSTAFAAIDGAVQKAFDFVAPAAAIQRVLDDPHLARLLGQSARKTVVTLYSDACVVAHSFRAYGLRDD